MFTTKPFTAQQLLEMPKDEMRYELVHGELVMMSPAGGRHGWISSRLNRLLSNHVESHRLGAVFAAETGFLLASNPDTVRAPDVAFVRTEQLNKLDDLDGFLPVAPDLVAEVVSPRDSSSQVEAKAAAWLEAGSAMVLVVDPANRAIRVYRTKRKIEVLHEGETLDAGQAVPGWKLLVAEVFPN